MEAESASTRKAGSDIVEGFSTRKENGIGHLYKSTGFITEQMLWETHIRLLLGWPHISVFRSVMQTVDELAEALHIPARELAERMARGVHEVRIGKEER